MAADVIAQEIDTLEQSLKDFQARSKAEAAQEAIVHGWTSAEGKKHIGLVEFDARFEGVQAPRTLEALRGEHEANSRAGYDADMQARAGTIRRTHAAIVRGLDEVAATVRRAPREKDAVVDSTRELAALQRFTGRTRAELVKVYQSTSDSANPTLVGLIENDLASLKLKADPDTDVEAVRELARAIATRQDARMPADVKAARDRAVAMLKPVNVSHVLAHFEGGRGVAVVLNPAGLRAV